MHRQGSGIASAQEWTVVGNGYLETGSAGAFSSVPVINSAVFHDPFALTITLPGGAAPNLLVKKQDGMVTLNPGKFNNITIQTEGQVTMNPGTYYITGTLALGSAGSLNATSGVTLIFSGNTSEFSMNSTASMVKITAPTTGTYAGFAVIQNPASDASGVTHTIQGGADTILKGIWYTPSAKLNITGGGGFNAASAYFPIVTSKFETTGSGTFRIGIDWAAYGYPVPLPLKFIQQAEVRLTY